MEPMKSSVMLVQVNDLPNVIRTEVRSFDKIIRQVLSPLEVMSLSRVYLVGDGDSFHASLATEMAFENIAKINCEPQSAMRFLEYGADFIPSNFPNDTLMVGISASGGTQRVVQSLERARNASPNIITLGMTGNPNSPVAQAGKYMVGLELPDLGRSPGIRTYAASLLGLYLLAIRIGELKNRFHNLEANQIRQELTNLSDVVEKTIAAIDDPTRRAAEAYKNAPLMMFLGSGPSYGTAMFSAAKVVEASGIFSMAQDLEEWAHVERFTYPMDTPTVIIAPPGRSYWRAVDLAKTAKKLGRRLVAVVREGDDTIAPLADFVFPVIGEVREEFSPLVYHVAANLFASRLAEGLGRMLFQSDNPIVVASMQPQPAPSAR
jgi:glutamine---fructose-6-phosphate transaminase (isomerizing)